MRAARGSFAIGAVLDVQAVALPIGSKDSFHRIARIRIRLLRRIRRSIRLERPAQPGRPGIFTEANRPDKRVNRNSYRVLADRERGMNLVALLRAKPNNRYRQPGARLRRPLTERLIALSAPEAGALRTAAVRSNISEITNPPDRW